jgi:hypothetical protein
MRLPLNFLLYVGSLGLIGQAGLWIYQASDKLGATAGSELTKQGQNTASDRVTAGKGQGPATVSWRYDNPEWWQLFKTANFIGKLPPKPVDPKAVAEDKPKALDVRPLEEIIELVTLMCDGDGKRTHVVVRYKTAANVKPPEDVLRQMAVATAPPPPTRDVAPAPGTKPPVAPAKPPPGSSAVKPTSQLPVNTGPREYQHQVKVGDSLWEPFTDIKLVSVSSDAEIATFSRKVPGSKPGDPPTERTDQLVRTAMGISQNTMQSIINARGSNAAKGLIPSKPAAGNKWIETEETKKIDSTWHIGSNDVKHFQENRDALLEGVNLEGYQSQFGSDMRGVRIANIDPGLSQRYGVQQGDVLLDVNGEKVRSRADALQVGQQQYNRGVRTFDVHFLSNGQVVTRTYQAPDRN